MHHHSLSLVNSPCKLLKHRSTQTNPSLVGHTSAAVPELVSGVSKYSISAIMQNYILDQRLQKEVKGRENEHFSLRDNYISLTWKWYEFMN